MTARDVNNHELEPEERGTLYGGAAVEAEMEAEAERSMASSGVAVPDVVVVVGGPRRWLVADEGGGSNNRVA